MGIFEQISVYFIFFGGCLCLLMAAEQITIRNQGPVNRVSALLLFCNAINTFATISLSKELYLAYPVSLYLFLPSIFSMGPLNYFYYDSLVNPQGLSIRKLRVHMIPAALVLLADTVFQFSPAGYQEAVIRKTFSLAAFTPLTAVIIMAGLHGMAYLAVLVTIEINLSRDRKIREEMLLVAACNGLAFVSGLFYSAGFLWGCSWCYLTAGIIITLIHVGIFIEHGRSPQFFHLLKSRIQERRYRISTLRGIDLDDVLERLEYLLENEKIYNDYDINLQGLADKLKITPHQLSELINDRMGMNFRTMINEYRIKEACRLLQSDEDVNILAVCFRVGFSSKSAFNHAFRKFSGMNPADYRARAVNKEKN